MADLLSVVSQKPRFNKRGNGIVQLECGSQFTVAYALAVERRGSFGCVSDCNCNAQFRCERFACGRLYKHDFVHLNLGTRSNASFQVVLTITQAVPNVTWTSPASVTYGTALSSSQLDATANIPGVLSYNPPSGIVLNSGNKRHFPVDRLTNRLRSITPAPPRTSRLQSIWLH